MKKKVIIYILVTVVAAALAIWLYGKFANNKSLVYLQTDVTKSSTISNIVTATGTLEALVTVNVGTQVSGRIEQLFVDYNSIVKKGELLAILDTEALNSALESAKAALDQAEAEYNYQQAEYNRYLKLLKKELIAQSDFDALEYQYRKSKANLVSAKAAYTKSRTNLDYAYIYSPIDGIVMEKNVEEGETVASNFETPTLFSIANDLTQMRIVANVDEADIGYIKNGQRVEFSVDAYPGKIFNGEVVELRLMPETSNNVVTYSVIIDAQNPEKLLMPGMTASVSFFVTEKKDILVIPNLALEFMPDPQLMESYARSHPEVTIARLGHPPESSNVESKYRLVWVIKDDSIYPVQVLVGETDEINYEVISGIDQGTEVITGIVNAQMSGNNDNAQGGNDVEKSPFMPGPPGGKK